MAKRREKTDQEKWKFKLLLIDRRNYAKKSQMEEENQDRQKSLIITEHEATPTQNHRSWQSVPPSSKPRKNTLPSPCFHSSPAQDL